MKGGCGSCGECMHGRDIICKHPAARITVTLTLTSPFSAVLKSGPSVTAVNGLRADIIEQKCFTRETCRFGNRTSMTLKTSALASHPKRFVILLTYVHLGNHTRKHRVKQIREKFWIHKSQKQKQDPCGDINAPKCFGDDYKCGLILLDLHCQSTNQITLACETSFVFALDDADALRQFQTYIRTYRLVIRVPGCKAGSWYAWIKFLTNVTKYVSH